MVFRTRPLIKCSPDEAEQIVIACAEQVESINEMLSDVEGRFTEIIDNFEWESFTTEQRSLLCHWHIGCRNAKHVLRSPNGI